MSAIRYSFFFFLVPLFMAVVGIVLGIHFGKAWRRRVKKEAADILHSSASGDSDSPAPAVPTLITGTEAAPDPAPCTLADVLREERLRRGMTQEFVAESLNVSRQAVSKWENGTSDPSTGNLLALARLYGISAADLLERVSGE